jgi:hypothetical protein
MGWSGSALVAEPEEETMNPESQVVNGLALKAEETAVATAERNAASNRRYKNGYAANRRNGRMTPAKAARLRRQAKSSSNGAPRFEGPAGAPWWKNPAWWIVGILAFKTLRKG